jgi:ATP-dependent DNA helicase RecG
MDIAQLRERIARGEDLHTDFKERFDSDRELAKDIVCFANTDGGQLIFGVANNRDIVGVVDPDWLCAKVDDISYQHCGPPITVVQEVLDVGGKKVVVVNIPKGDQRPYGTKSGHYYVRTTSGCRQASQAELLRLFQATEALYYDETPLPRLSLAELDRSAVELFLEETGQAGLGVDLERLLRNWRLLSGDHPTIAGVVLFGRRPQQHLPFAQINAFRFPGTDSATDPLDAKDLTGRLLDVIDQAQRFLYLHLPVPHKIQGFEPEAKPELPEEALREAIVNAVAHRDYTVHGPIRLFIFDDRIEIHTPGKAPNTVDEAAMRAGIHVVRNPHIYARLSDAGVVTRAGSGIRRMSRLVREATGHDIGLDLREFEVLLTIPRKGGVQ